MSAAQINSGTAAICLAAEMDEVAVGLVRAELHPRDYVALLMNKKLYTNAVRFLAHALPRREAVWWAWYCARQSAGETPRAKIKTALEATERWIRQPGEENRLTALAAAQEAELGSAAGCAALAAFLSGGSLAPPGVPAVPPDEYLTAKAVSGAVIFASVGQAPEKAPEKFASFVAQGVRLSERIGLWANAG